MSDIENYITTARKVLEISKDLTKCREKIKEKHQLLQEYLNNGKKYSFEDSKKEMNILQEEESTLFKCFKEMRKEMVILHEKIQGL